MAIDHVISQPHFYLRQERLRDGSDARSIIGYYSHLTLYYELSGTSTGHVLITLRRAVAILVEDLSALILALVKGPNN